MSHPESDTELLLEKSAAGDSSAAQTLLARCQPRLRRMVVAHLDQRISARVDPSDVVQETLTEAFQRLPAYAREPAISFYPWLRQIAWQRLIKLHRAHLNAARRSVHRENDFGPPLSGDSVALLANQLIASGTEPGQKAMNQRCENGCNAPC